MVERVATLLQGAVTAERTRAALARMSATELAAFDRLSPEAGTDLQKLKANAFTCRDAGPNVCGIFLTMSRINNNCIGNCSRYYDNDQRLRHLVASRTIRAGEELSIAYLPVGSGDLMHAQTRAARNATLAVSYGFACSCQACTDPETAAKLDRIDRLFGDMHRLGTAMRLDAALQASKEQLQLMEDLQLDSGLMAFVCSYLFQTAVLRNATMSAARLYATRCAEHAAAYYGINDEMAVQHREYASKPQLRDTYRMADRC